jgi:RHS repeat-associated protein
VLQASYKYNPYGGLISSIGALASANRMRFSSKPAIFSSSGAWGFYYYGYRFYDPVNQRWLNRDPLEEGGGVNLYGFVLGDPLNHLDLYGMWGVKFAELNIGIGDPTYDFDDVDWNGYWGDVGDTMIGELKGAGANLSFGLYSPCYRNDLQRQGGAVGDGLVTAAQLATGAGAAAQGIARGGFKMSVKSAYKHAKNPKIPVSMAWENVRRRMLKKKLIAPNEPVHHWLFHQASRVPDSIKNLPFNLMPISKFAHDKAHYGNLAQYLWYGTPRWAKMSLGGLGSASASHGSRMLLDPCGE